MYNYTKLYVIFVVVNTDSCSVSVNTNKSGISSDHDNDETVDI